MANLKDAKDSLETFFEWWVLIKPVWPQFVVCLGIATFLLWLAIDKLYEARIANLGTTVQTQDKRISLLQEQPQYTHEEPSPENRESIAKPKLEIIKPSITPNDDGVFTIKTIVKVVSQYAPNSLTLMVRADFEEDLKVKFMGTGMMSTRHTRISPSYQIMLIMHPIGPYEIIIKTKYPKSVVIDHQFK